MSRGRKIGWSLDRRAIHRVACQKRSADPVWRAKQKAGCQKRSTSSVYRAKLKAAGQARSADPVWRAAQKVGTQKRSATPEWRVKNKAGNQKKAADPEYRATQKAACQKRSANPAWRIKLMVGCQKRTADPAWRAKNEPGRRRAAEAARRARPSSIERIVWSLLDKFGVFYVTEHRIGPYLADIFVPEKKLVIECDGSYWHRDKEKDVRRDIYMRERGYGVLRLPEQDIRDGRANDSVLRAVK